jgi:hypothetical protein
MNRVEIDTKKLRDELGATYFVQWMTKFDSITGHLQVVGYCVRDKSDSQWATVFQHKERSVCQKIADILNEEGANKC